MELAVSETMLASSATAPPSLAKRKNQVGSEVTVHLPQARMPPPAPASLINAKPSATRSSEAQQ
jgi:hypothetical protein